ncbi:MAG: hypothetical protein UT89_C0009G0003 [Parcubacteria group bacterium GW2011_GWE1_40_20]|nr:MAG: hypothetical protein UT89_C0009G0003 [Parcubacteria group bacterium GW2011_GWE1_40_20]
MNTKKITISAEDGLLVEINKRMGVIISLLLRMVQQDKSSISLKDQVCILDNLGMRPRDIANILGRSQPHINKELTGIRKGKRKEKNEQEK